MSLTLITSDRFEDHVTPPGHPECVERAEVMQVVASSWRAEGGAVAAPREATRAELARVHTGAFLDRIAGTAGRAVSLDPDTFTSPASHQVALLAAGAGLVGVEMVLEGGRASRAFALVRPPGHHAEADRAMGFCLYNNIAVAAAHALARGVSRLAVVDYDVHHGNGTQQIFYEDRRVLYVSTHQYPYYPGTGAAEEVGTGDGAGFTLNVPLEAGATDADYRLIFSSVIVPVLDEFRPTLLLVSAGFDAHERDPLAGMRLSTPGYRELTAMLSAVADRWCDGRVVMITEGGYDLKALRECLEGAVAVLATAGPQQLATIADRATWRATNAIKAVRAAHSRFWAAL